MIEQSKLKERLSYNPSTGCFTWLKRTDNKPMVNQWNGKLVGKTAGTSRKTKQGKTYIFINVSNKISRAHRLAFIYMNGSIPSGMEVDHINGDGTDNRWENLRLVNRTVNSQNHRKNSNNTSGVTGVVWNKRASKWMARIGFNGKTINLGYFDDLFSASLARKEAENKYGYHKNHGVNRPL